MSLILTADTDPGVASFLGFGAAGASEPLLVTQEGGVVTDETRLVVATIPAGVFIPSPSISLPSTYPVGVPLVVIRTDTNVAGLTVEPESGTIDGTDFVAVPNASGGASGFVFVYDGTNWWTGAST